MRSSTYILTTSLFLGLIAATAMAGELLAPGVISTGLQETSAAVTPDGKTVYFMRSDFAEKDDTILVSRRDGKQWSTPEIAPFSGQWHDSEPAISPDGKRLYFVSNRPVQEGGTALVAELGGKQFPGTNLWYVEQQPNGKWSAPVHVDGQLNDGAQIYNPSIAANGNIYFSAHRPDSGKLYQIYVARRTPSGYSPPERVELGDVAQNRMDPGIDPQERYIVYSGNEGDSVGSTDIYISFRGDDGKWAKPERLPGDINSASLDIAPVPGRVFGELYLSSNRSDGPRYPKVHDDLGSLQHRLASPENGSRNIWHFDISLTLKGHGLDR
ncbi:WD40 repeat protein [Luteibacter sp. OK325]|uniref:TolB family protein n=1 Tax=Luteibacter sp. OK325 TaxID=2135670 RepID=UPI000D397FFF|nr:PD40 domain-containing protein [Luteibacter sp. OK325]PTR34311.1 WD40 repeat protein [Luteibacter sp. OK325]